MSTELPSKRFPVQFSEENELENDQVDGEEVIAHERRNQMEAGGVTSGDLQGRHGGSIGANTGSNY